MRGEIDRRGFLKLTGTAVAVMAAANAFSGTGLALFRPGEGIVNPLIAYPNRDWERIYRDQYAYDDTFTFVCAPNDTHMCRLRAFVRNGVVVRTEQNYDGGDYGDPQGNSSTVAWNPRGCLKGYTLHRRVYGPHRAKTPMIRAGWKEWADAGYPSLSDDPELRTTYRFDSRGEDDWVRVSWDEANGYVARALHAIAETYSGDDGRRRLIERDGYPEEMLTHWEEAGTRTIKMGSSLPPHGVAGKFGIFRFANMLALLDAQVRGVGPEEALGGRILSEYTWRGDQAPGFPFVHGLQSSEVDFNDLRNSKLLIQCGKNLVENKMPESHFFHEVMERGGKLVSIVPEYGPQSTKADYWIPVRPGLSDTSLFLGIAKALIDGSRYDADFVTRFTDLPLLVRLDTLRRLRADEVFAGYQPGLATDGPSFLLHGLTADDYARIGDRVVFDRGSGGIRAITREDVGDRLSKTGIDPDLEYTGDVTLTDGSTVKVATVFAMYRTHLRDYDLDTVTDITGAPRDLIERLIEDLATIKPAAIHIGEGVNHYFHATLHNRAVYLVMMLTGNIGTPGSGVSTWAGNYKGAIFHGAPWHGPGAGGYVFEDPFNPLMRTGDRYTSETVRAAAEGEDTSYWGFGDRPLIVDTPREGRKVFTGLTHMPSPTKVLWYNNANLINQAKWAYELVHSVNPKIDLIVDQQIEWTGSAEFADVMLPANSWLEQQTLEMGGSPSNPFLQIWKGGIEPLNDTRDDVAIFTGVAAALSEVTGETRFADYFRFALEGRPEVYLDRVLDASITTSGYTVSDIMAGRYGEPGGALMQYRTYPRVPFYEQIKESLPFYTDTGRLNAYCDIPEAIEYGENLIVHREAVEATPYMPNVIVSTSPYTRPVDYGIPPDETGADLRAVRNLKMPWADVKRTTNPLWEQGYRFYCLTPKSRHTVHSSWAVTDWNELWASNFSDPFRTDRRLPGVGEPQLHMSPRAAKDLGIDNGDYVWVDANPADRPFRGWRDDAAFYEVARLLVRVTYNPAFPYDVTMLKHAMWMSTPRTVRATKTRGDGRALAEGTGYQSSFRSGSQQSLTRAWAPPMHQTDSLFHKKAGTMGFVFGFDEDNHAVNTTPKETLVRVTKAEAGGVAGRRPWARGESGMTPGGEDRFMDSYIAGKLIDVKGR
jgi:nitrate reductase alpha subunit